MPPRERSRTRDGTAGNDRLEPELLTAVEADNVTSLERVLDKARQNGQFSEAFLKIGLMRSAERNKPNASKYLLLAGANPNGMGKGNRTGPLMRAVERNNVTIVKILLDSTTIPVDRNEADKKGRTALMTAAWKNHTEILELLITAGADINAKDNRKRNVLHNLAADTKEAVWGQTVINLLLGHNVCVQGPEAMDEHGRTPLHWCCVTGRLSLAETLLKRGHGKRADINAVEQRQKSPLHLAVSHEWEDIVDLLLLHGARIDLTSDGGWTALHNACEKGNARIVRTLLSAGADCNARLLNGRTSLHVASNGLHVEVVQMLLAETQVKRYARDGFGFTSFLLAAQRKPEEFMTKELLLAFKKKQRECVELLAPNNHADSLSYEALGACQGFFATVTDFGNYKHGNEVRRRSIYELLYARSIENPHKPAFEITPNERKATQFRWIHLPANNLAWIEALMTKHFVEEGHHDVDGFKAIERSFSLQHRGQQVHSHFMRPLCQTFSRAPKPEEVAPEITLEPEPILSAPRRINTGMSAEAPTLLSSASESIPETHAVPIDGKDNVKPKKPRKANTRPNMGKKSSSRENGMPKGSATLRKTSSSADSATITRLKTNSDLRHEISPKANVILFSPFLHFETTSARGKMHSAIEKARERSRHNRRVSEPSTKELCSDEMLIRAHLSNTSLSLHIRRTLDQYMYHNIDTEFRDQDQVVYRYQNRKNHNSVSTDDPKIFMVDQLWMWILGKDLIVTSFPQRWQQPRNDPLNMLEGIIEDVNSKTRDSIKSVYDLALTITARCSGVFGRHRVGDGEYQFLDMFESTIGEATDKETLLFRQFNDASKKASEWLKTHRKSSRFQRTQEVPSSEEPHEDKFHYDEDRQGDPLFVDQLLDIGKETELLAESKDIRDEINMINKVLDDQKQVLRDLESAVCDIYRDEHKSQQEVKKRIRDQLKTIDTHVKDLDRMDKQAERIYDSITVLLDLKQKHANAFEARFARDQAAGTARQSQTIMVFTIVTIVFLPLSFIASFFTINIGDFPRSGAENNWALPMDYVSKFIFGIGFAISIPLILIALQLDRIVDAWRTLMKKWPRRKDSVTQHIEETIEVYRKSMEVVSVSSGIARVKSRRRESTWESGDGSLPRWTE
ncbi:ankyrin [Myriangium duriaei CBS 260.36]|uniref:Ankyrin n=1 Tax=Myriangium duriaei CBS 260.36 TaxID=1168546 RepID=A0A9P4IW25_9PEZI|nr:ankyrin [Myriangium duriaei CBS 260.36]